MWFELVNLVHLFALATECHQMHASHMRETNNFVNEVQLLVVEAKHTILLHEC